MRWFVHFQVNGRDTLLSGPVTHTMAIDYLTAGKQTARGYMRSQFLIWLCFIGQLAALQSWGQDATPSDQAAISAENPGAPAKSSKVSEPEQKPSSTIDRSKFDSAFERWKKVTAEYLELAQRWHMSPPTANDRETRFKWAELQAQARALMDESIIEATKIVRQDMRAYPELTVYLLRCILYRDEHDWFELTGDAADALLQGGNDTDTLLGETGIPISRIQRIAGISYFMTMEVDKAEPYLKAAAAADALREKEKGIETVLDGMRELYNHDKEHRDQDLQKDDLPQIRLVTSRGPVVIELFEDDAPNTVANFIHLAEKGFYDNNRFYQVLRGVRAITGDQTGDGNGNAGYFIEDENTHRPVVRGSVVMAKIPDGSQVPGAVVPHSASSQFFITFSPVVSISKSHCVFGRVISGMDTLCALTIVDPQAKDDKKLKQATPDVVFRVEVIRKRDHPYEPKHFDKDL